MVKVLNLFILLFVASCVQPPTTSIEDGSTNTGNNSNQIDDAPVEVNITMSWKLGQNFLKTLTISPENTNYSYTFGDDVQNYLLLEENYNSDYCLITTYTLNDNSTKELRLRATPGFQTNYSTGTREYYFRVLTATESGNDFCNKPTLAVGASTSIAAPANLAYHSSDLCSTCTNILIPNNIKFYKYNSTEDILNQVSISDLKTDDLRLQISYTNNGSNSGDNNTTSCSNESCNAQGFDCCLSGTQCANNQGLIKDPQDMSAAELAEYNMAQAQSANDPNWYLQYPNIYYICPDIVVDEDNDSTDPNDQANADLQQRLIDYQCVNELETNAIESPFNENLINSLHTYLECNTTDNQSNMYYEEVMKRLYANCGCDSQFITLADQINNCPSYTYRPEYVQGSDGNPTTEIADVACFIPSSTDNPFGTQVFQISDKSAPHRFFNTEGVELNFDESPLASENVNQEGSPFIYLDDDYIFPQNGSFNMNSVLGQMNVTLDLAKPAKQIDIEFDRQYYIAGLSGYYTPCPSCAKDPWFGNFSPLPISSQTVGLQNIGYTTRRDSFGTNTTLGNYSDTHFGRACFLPPTMLPFSHKKYADSQTQRLRRLETQAAMYVNGYQKDWFGFNQGALIGSFDGVTWFPIGDGRVVRSTTKKLFLAINAPYADLAITATHSVSVQEWNGNSSGARFDFDPNLTLNHPNQNKGGTCQDNYQCNVDSDCITKLGWEYSCQNVNAYNTKWPNFNPATGAEIEDSESSSSIAAFLQEGQLPSADSKRCVYRGSGSICRTDYENITDESIRKKLSCAPNFYCASVNSAGAFNKELSRFGAPLSNLVESNNHLFGKDANLLGRPKHYIAKGQGGSSLPISVRNAIRENVLLIDSSAGNNAGLCLPGKSLASPGSGATPNNYRPKDQHTSDDTDKRTDYISQIGGCNSLFISDFKYSSCPILDDDGNYIVQTDDFLNNNIAYIDAILSSKARSQNACGLESLSVDQGGSSIVSNADNINGFFNIEAKELNDGIISNPTLVQNACLRRAGAVCHTDLDCSPNSLHAEAIDLLNPSFFGNEAEKNYWSESLVCAQGTREPALGDSNFNTYNITNNRCCREIGSTLTLYSEADESDSVSMSINADKFSSTYPGDADRYSRYSVLSSLGDEEVQNADGEITQYATPTASTDLGNASNILVPNQWKTINKTASKTCCGGGWIRKFADGTNDWTINRLNLDFSQFSCINSKTPLTHLDEENIDQIDADPFYYNALQNDLGKFCYDSDRNTGSCSDQAIGEFNSLIDIQRPILNNTTSASKVYTLNSTDNNFWVDADHDYSFFPPTSNDSNSLTFLNWNEDYLQDTGQIRRNISIQLPAYIPLRLANPAGVFGVGNLSEAILKVSLGKTGQTECTPFNFLAGWYGMISHDFTSSWSPPACGYSIDKETRTMKISFRRDQVIENINPADSNNLPGQAYGASDDIYYAQIEYIAPGTKLWETTFGSGSLATVNDDIESRRASSPGNALYYLEKLAKLELIGIPQVTFEPLFCNNNYQKLVPGIFKNRQDSPIDGVNNVNDVNLSANFFLHDDIEKRPWDDAGLSADEVTLNKPYVTTKKMLAHGEIFSSSEVMCCTPLGKEAQSSSQCCSGLAAQGDDGDQALYCKIPSGVDLNVYFNKFVSNEGTDPDASISFLVEDDFDSETGAPLQTTSVRQKIAQLGADFCINGSTDGTPATTAGAAFGLYRPQPIPPGQSSQGQNPIFNIVDSFSDSSTQGTEFRGAGPFSNGQRWNHHIYCK